MVSRNLQKGVVYNDDKIRKRDLPLNAKVRYMPLNENASIRMIRMPLTSQPVAQIFICTFVLSYFQFRTVGCLSADNVSSLLSFITTTITNISSTHYLVHR